MKRSILIVDDSAVHAEHTMQMLRQRGFGVAWATSGLDGLEMARRLRPDLVLLDVVMPDLDGHAVCRWLKQHKHTRDTPIIMLTGRDAVDDRVRGLELGADDYLPKACDSKELEARITAALRAKSVRAELRTRNAHLETMLDRMSTLAMTDALTGLWNRRRFTDALERELAASRRYGTPVSSVMLDLDHFKATNDTHGHAAGDAVLIVLAEIVRMNLRRVDVAARFGGEEFALLLPQTTKAGARVIATRIGAALRAHAMALPTGTLRTSASFGVAEASDIADGDGDALLHAADLALYEAKRSGRDRVVLYHPTLAAPRDEPV